MFNPDEIKKVLGNDPDSYTKLQELLNVLQKTKEKMNQPTSDTESVSVSDVEPSKTSLGNNDDTYNTDGLEEAPSSLQQNPDLRRKLLKQKLYAMKAKRLTNNAKTNIQEKIKKKILETD